MTACAQIISQRIYRRDDTINDRAIAFCKECDAQRFHSPLTLLLRAHTPLLEASRAQFVPGESARRIRLVKLTTLTVYVIFPQSPVAQAPGRP